MAGHILVLVISLCFARGLADTQFKDLSYNDLENRLKELNSKAAKYFTAANIWPDVGAFTQSTGVVKTIIKGGAEGCSPSILQVTHVSSHKKDVERPQILVSGEIHGNERIGPQAALFAAQLLVWAGKCLVHESRRDCDRLADMGVTEEEQEWLAFLGSRRDTYIAPTLNCLGYKQNRRDDNGIDPNRDFPYGRGDKRCLRSGTAKVTYLIMRNLLVHSVVTYHGGMVALGYEWGSMNHRRPSDKSPDHAAHADMAQAMALFAGKHPTRMGRTGAAKPTAVAGSKATTVLEKKQKLHKSPKGTFYRPATMNSIVYPVAGGMEDWCYAAGFDPKELKNCTVFRELPMSRYVSSSPERDAADIKALTFIVETADHKKPLDETLGTNSRPLDYNVPVLPENGAGGHVPRNARLALAAIDMAQPYICLHVVDSSRSGVFNVSWSIGGASRVQSTFLSLHSLPTHEKDVMGALNTGQWTPLLQALHQPVGAAAEFSPPSDPIQGVEVARVLPNSATGQGRSRWRSRDVVRDPDTFTTTLGPDDARLRHVADGRYWVVAWTSVDQAWGNPRQGSPATIGPQSHGSLQRTDPDYRVEHTVKMGSTYKRVVQGRRYWPSDPVVVEVAKGRIIAAKSFVLRCRWWKRQEPISVR